MFFGALLSIIDPITLIGTPALFKAIRPFGVTSKLPPVTWIDPMITFSDKPPLIMEMMSALLSGFTPCCITAACCEEASCCAPVFPRATSIDAASTSAFSFRFMTPSWQNTLMHFTCQFGRLSCSGPSYRN